MAKIAHIVTTYGSVVTILHSKLQRLALYKDLDVVVISSPKLSGEVRVPPVRHIAIEISRKIKLFADLRSIWQLYKIFKHEKVDVAHSHTSKAGFISTIAARMAGVPLILHTHHGLSFYKGQGKVSYYMHFLLEKIACMLRSHTFTQNRGDIANCVRLIGSEAKVSFEGNGVDVEFVARMAEEQLADAIKKYPSKGLKIALVCRLEPVKRVPDFLKTIRKLSNDGYVVSCIIAGGGILEPILRTQIEQMGLAKRVSMVGRTVKPYGLIKASDVVMLCSEKEGIPRALMEAMALKKVVVATDVAGTQELVADGETGFLIPVGDIDSLAGKIKTLANDQNLRSRMGKAGYERVCESFNDVKIAEFLHNFYLNALNHE